MPNTGDIRIGADGQALYCIDGAQDLFVPLVRLDGVSAQLDLDLQNGVLPTEARNAGLSTVTATIANGASISGDLDLGSAKLVGIDMPAAWTSAVITLQASSDGSTWGDVYTYLGAEYVIQAAALRRIVVPVADMLSFRRLRVRSGTSAAPVNQGGVRTLTLRVQP